MTPTSSLQWAQLQDAFAAGDVLAAALTVEKSLDEMPVNAMPVGNIDVLATQVPHSVQGLTADNQLTLSEPARTRCHDSVMQADPLAVLLLNIERYNLGERGDVEQQLALAVPTLVKIGLFNVFSPSEWIRTDNAGRRLVGLFAEQYLAGPQK